MEIKFTDMDIVEINMKVAEQCLIKASIEENIENKSKALLFARQSIDGALSNLGINHETKISSNFKNNKCSLVKKT